MKNMNSYRRKLVYLLLVIIAMIVAYVRMVGDKEIYGIYVNGKMLGTTDVELDEVKKMYGNARARSFSANGDIGEVYLVPQKQGVFPSDDDEEDIAEAFNREVDGESVYLDGKVIRTITRENEYSEKVIYVEDSELYEDESEIFQEAEPGIKQTRVMQTYYNGTVVDERIISEEIISMAKPRIVRVGTRQRPEYCVPVCGYTITSYFGTRWGRNHNGVDMAVVTGTEVKSTAQGTVIQSGVNGGYGISVTIDHGNGMVSVYGHLSEALVVEGQVVNQGEIIGYSGNTGRSTGPHLHFELRFEGTPVDPFLYLTDM